MESPGFKAGETLSGKQIRGFLLSEKRQFPHPSAKKFDLFDHYCAHAVFAHLFNHEKGRTGEDSEWTLNYQAHATAHYEMPKLVDKLLELRTRANAADVFGDLALGRKLCSAEFREP